jgi:rubrerythrin
MSRILPFRANSLSNVVVFVRQDGSAYFDCLDCGTRVIRFESANEPPLCPICIAMPGWFNNCELRKLYGYEPQETNL